MLRCTECERPLPSYREGRCPECVEVSRRMHEAHAGDLLRDTQPAYEERQRRVEIYRERVERGLPIFG